MVTYDSQEGFRLNREGIQMKNLVHGEHTMMMQFLLDEGSHIPRHSHPQEQTGYLVAGSLRFTIGEKVYTLSAGDSWCIPGGVPHKVDTLQDSIVLEVFSPLRDDYLD